MIVIKAPVMAEARLNHQIAWMPFSPTSPEGSSSTLIPIEPATDVMMDRVKFCTVTKRLPAEPWYDLGTLEVMKIVTAAKLKSGPNVDNATPGIDSAQYGEFGVCGRKNTGPRPKHTILVARIQ